MEKINKNLSYTLFDSFTELESEEDRKLCTEALIAVKLAYAPYSGYPVGAACLLSDGSIIKGSNQENAVYPLTNCAERVALNSASSQKPDQPIVAIAVATAKKLSESDTPPFPCGACRQSIIETENRYSQNIRIFVVGSNKKVILADSARDLLPFSFDRNSL